MLCQRCGSEPVVAFAGIGISANAVVLARPSIRGGLQTFVRCRKGRTATARSSVLGALTLGQGIATVAADLAGAADAASAIEFGSSNATGPDAGCRRGR
jgi:hypothetical protein